MATILRLTGHLSGEARDAVASFLAQSGWRSDDHDKAVRKKFEDSCIESYRAFIEDALGVALPISEARCAAICRLVEELDLDKSRLSRWRNGARPKWEKLFLGVAALDLDFRRSWPNPLVVKRNAMITSMQFIRESILKKPSASPLSVTEFECVYAVGNSPWLRAVRNRSSHRLAQASRDVSDDVSRQMREEVRFEIADIERVLAAWLQPWVLFHQAINVEWRY